MYLFVKKYRTVAVVIIIMLCEFFFFRYAISTDALFGDIGDGRFCNYVVEHWYKVLLRKESLLDVNMFFPVANDFAYSDLFLGFAPFYCIFRFLGLSLYNAFKYSIILIHIFGAIGIVILLHNFLGVSYRNSLVGMAICSYSNAAMIFLHPQYIALAFVPFYMITGSNFLNCINETSSKRIKYALLTLIIFALIFYTAGYVGYYVFIMTLLGIVIYAILNRNLIWDRRSAIYKWLKKNKWEIFLYCCIAVLLFIPFLFCYLPVKNNNGTRTWNEVSTYLPLLSDYFSIDSHNYMYGKLLNLGFTASNSVAANGIPLITVIAFITSFLVLKKKKQKGLKDKYVYILSIIVLAAICISIKFNGNLSIWYLIYAIIPGASSMRAAGTFMLMLPILISICIAYVLDMLTFPNHISYYTWIFLLVIQYVWSIGTGMYWHAGDRESYLKQVTPPPADCKMMYVVRDKNQATTWDTVPQMTSWEIADYFGINNIGGYSSYYAENWDMIDVSSVAYEYNAYVWCQNNMLSDVYAYNLDTDMWTNARDFPSIELVSNKLPMNDNVDYIDNYGALIGKSGTIAAPYSKFNAGIYSFDVYGDKLDNTVVAGYDGSEEYPIEIEIYDSQHIKGMFELSNPVSNFYIAIINAAFEDRIHVNSFIISKR